MPCLTSLGVWWENSTSNNWRNNKLFKNTKMYLIQYFLLKSWPLKNKRKKSFIIVLKVIV